MCSFFLFFFPLEPHRGPQREADKDFVMKLLVNLAAPVLSRPRHKAQSAATPTPSSLPLIASIYSYYSKVEWERWVLLCFYSFLFPFWVSTSAYFNSRPWKVHSSHIFFTSISLVFSQSHCFSLWSFLSLLPSSAFPLFYFLLLSTFFATFCLFPPSVLIFLSPSTSPHPHIFFPFPLSYSSSPPSLPVLSFACALMGWWPFRQGSIEVKRCDGRVLLSREQRLRDAGPNHCPSPILALPQFCRI